MTQSRILPVLFAATLIVTAHAAAAAPGAQRGGGHARGGGAPAGRAVPRPGPVAGRPNVGRPVVVSPRVVGPYRGYYPYRSGFSLGFYAGYPYGYYSPYNYYGYYGAPYPYAYPYSYGVAATPYGGGRVEGAPHDAQVFADGYYAGIVDDFDGTFQQLSLEPGAHHVEIRVEGQAP